MSQTIISSSKNEKQCSFRAISTNSVQTLFPLLRVLAEARQETA